MCVSRVAIRYNRSMPEHSLLINGSALNAEKIGLATYPCREVDSYIWVFMADASDQNRRLPDVPRLPLPSEPYRMIQISSTLNCAIDDVIVGFLDPAHGPFVHQSSWWRTQASMHEKTKPSSRPRTAFA